MLFLELGAVLIGLAVVARIAGAVSIPAIPLYLAAGLAFGEGGLFPLGASEGFIHAGAELGLILVLFMLGLEHPARELVTTLRQSAFAGALDLVLNFTPGFLAGLLFGWGFVVSMFLGVATYITSSGVAGRLVQALALSSRESRTVVSILIVEDLAMAVFLPVLGAMLLGASAARGALTAIGAVIAVVGIIALAMRVDERLSRVVFSRSDEVLLLSILGFGLVIAGAAELLEVSAAVGALLAGMLVSGATARGARALLTPLRDLFAAMFFAFIGFSVDPRTLGPVIVPAILLAVVTGATKVATGIIAGRRAGCGPVGRAVVGATLIARGEFSLAVAGLAVAARVEPSPAPLIVSYVVLMAVAGPIIARLVYPMVRLFGGGSAEQEAAAPDTNPA